MFAVQNVILMSTFIIIFWVFVFAYQQTSFLKNDIKDLKTKNREFSREINEIRYKKYRE